jgi:uncharacterized protein
MQKSDFIIGQTALPGIAVEQTLQLFAEDCSIPFIARYRKERTGGLDEVDLAKIEKAAKAYEALINRKTYILKQLEAEDQLSEALKTKIDQVEDLNQLEDLYLPFKKKRKTKASVAREQGLEPLAKILMSGNYQDFDALVNRFKGDLDFEQALEGARHIMAEWFSERQSFRNMLRRDLSRGMLISKKASKIEDQEKAETYRDYFDWQEPVSRIPSHRILAVFRAWNEGILKVGIQIDSSAFIHQMCQRLFRSNGPEREQIELAAADAYKRLLFPSLEREVLGALKLKADEVAINVFAGNLEQLLLASPLGEKRVLALDPGFRTGCKLVCLDAQGNLKHNETLFPFSREGAKAAQAKLSSLVEAYKIEAIAIGNGTASRETMDFVKKTYLKGKPEVFLVNESGASIYSASKIARAEFPDYDITVRGSVSIGRRLQDPLAELVKIDPKSIGVGQYQHEVDQSLLQEELNRVVSFCVNKVGVNLNTASASLLSHVSGIGPKLAENIVAYRKENGSFTSRKSMKKVPRLGDKAYQQCVAFLRIKDSSDPLDDSAVHPESYHVVDRIAQKTKLSIAKLVGNKSILENLNPVDFVDDQVGLPTVKDILKELAKPGLDPREKAKAFKFSSEISSIEDIETGMILPGLVNNITNFGCFVDLGIKQSGLVHISRLSKGFVSDINQVVKLGDEVSVKVIEVDLKRKRIQLAMDYD